MLSENIKNEIIERIKQFKPEKIILFGSYVYGTPDMESDIDICVIKRNYNSKMEEKRKIREALKGIRKAKDILVPSLEEYEFYKKEINSVYYDIEKRGVVLCQKN